MKSYAYAKLPKSGLANKLFPWARCIVEAEKAGLEVIQPIWSQIKLGPILRGERDSRLYVGLFKPITLSQQLLRLYVLATYPKMEEQDFIKSKYDKLSNCVVQFGGLKKHFARLNGFDEIILRKLREMVRSQHLAKVIAFPEMPIAIHVRRGDFSSSDQAHPNSWYISTLQFVRSIVGPKRAYVFTDAPREELEDLLNQPNVELVDGNNVVTDLLLLSKCRFMVGTGSSSFSAWAAFLGQMPAVTRKGNPFSWWALQNRKDRFIGEFLPGQSNDRLVNELQQTFL